MKTKTAIKALLAAGILLAAVTGCANRGATSHNSDPGKDYSTGDFGISDKTVSSENSSAETSEPPEEAYAPNFYEKTIESEGKVVGTTKQLNDKYLMAMDNDYVYLVSNDFPTVITGLDRNDYSSFCEVMTYDLDIELELGGNRKTYCGWYFAFPCYGDPLGDVTMRAYAGKPGEQMKCIFDENTYMIDVIAAELNETEMVFSRYSENVDAIEIYKYRVGSEQAELIYTETLGSFSLDSCPEITCYNGQIYLIYCINPQEVVIKTLNPDGKEVKSETVEMPPNYATWHLLEFTVAKNDYLIRFRQPSTGSLPYVIIDRKSKKTFTSFGENRFGSRFNDSRVDGRYILFVKSGPKVVIFDAETSDFHILTFLALKDVEVMTYKADGKGDIMFMTKDEKGATSLVLYEDVTSLI